MNKQTKWWLLGWLFIRWWHKLTQKLSWKPWWYKTKQYIADTEDALVKHKWRHFVVQSMRCDSWKCPHCRYDGWIDHDELFHCEDSGTYANPMVGTVHWWEGQQECYRCGKSEYYKDST